jgi:hypothetical protein
MNTPKSKPLKRYPQRHSSKQRRHHLGPYGQYNGGLWNPEHAKLVGQITTYMPQIEEQMIQFMSLLISDKKAPARQIFRSLNSEQARIQIMRALLETAPHNKDKPGAYDEIIDLFDMVRKKRNAYVHGLWTTHEDSGRAFLAEASADETYFTEQREVSAKELELTIREMGDLFVKINRVLYSNPPQPPSLDTYPLPPDE